MKKLLSLLLVLVMVFSLLPLSALAAEEDVQTETEQSLETEGSVGTLLGNTLDGAALDDDASGCSVIDIRVEGTIATVEYQTDRASELVVAVYEEESTQMLASGHTAVSPDADTATVTIETDAMPAYFVVMAYLLQADGLEPLCDAYTSSYYTKEVTELRQKTADDFDDDLVLLLEEGNTETNFLVFSNGTLQAEQGETANQITDNGDGTYTIANADERFLSLSVGDSFSYTYADGTVLVVVAKSVSVSGTTVTVTADTDAELEDVFDYVKIEATSDGAEPIVDTSTMDEGITYLGYEENATVPMDGALLDEKASVSHEINYGLDVKLYESADKTESVSLKGTIKMAIKASLELYITLTYQYVDFTLKDSDTFSVTVSGKVTACEKSLAKIDVPLLEGVVSFRLEPKVVLEFSGSVTLSVEQSTSYGWVYDSNNGGFTNKSSEPKTKSKLEFKGEVFLGVKLKVAVVVGNDVLEKAFGEEIAELYFSATAGLKISMAEDLLEDGDDMRHECYACYDGEIKVVLELEFGIKILKVGNINRKITLAEKKLCDVYWSWGFSEFDTHMEFGFTTCPHKSYKLTVNAADSNGEAVAAAAKIADKSTGETLKFKDGAINSAGSESLTTTAGKAEVFLPNGEYTVTLSYHGETKTKNITVHNKSTKTSFYTGQNGPTEEDGKIVYSGSCGKDVKWDLYSGGLLYISGTGAMEKYSSASNSCAPWYKYREGIEKIVIADGVTTIGEYAFYSCAAVTQVTIPDSVTSIGNSAFEGCTALMSITIPDSVTSIGDSAFYGCTSLTNITIPDSVTSIGSCTFYGCHSLTEVSYDGSDADWNKIDISGGNEYLVGAFINGVASGTCGQNLAWRIAKADGVLTISGEGEMYDYNYTFMYRREQPWETISAYIRTVLVGNGVTSIGEDAFLCCFALERVIIEDGVESIEKCAFSNCSSLTDVYYTGTEEQWGDISISSYNTCLTSANIHYNYVPTTTVTLDEAAGPAEETPPKEIIEEVSAETTEEVTTEEAIEETTTEETTTEETTTEENATEETTTYEADEIELLAAYTGTTDGNTASFDGLVPNERYVLLVVKDAAADDILAAENLLYIVQGVSGETGALNFTYTPREDAADAAAVVYGAAGTPVSEAKITIGMTVGGDVVVTATANGITLVENEDYTYTSTEVDGVISVTVIGSGEYIGTVTVTLDHVPGDMDGKDGVTILDVLTLLKAVAGIASKPAHADVNNDGVVSILDVLQLLKYVAGIAGTTIY